jgi:hypothetical protein
MFRWSVTLFHITASSVGVAKLATPQMSLREGFCASLISDLTLQTHRTQFFLIISGMAHESLEIFLHE